MAAKYKVFAVIHLTNGTGIYNLQLRI